jgi:DNA-binding NarL/FixJ family response regulator
VGIIEDHTVLRESLARVLALEEDVEVSGQWSKAEDAIEDFGNNPCDVYLMDLKLPGMNGIQASRHFLRLDSRVKIIVLSAYTEEKDVLKALEVGVLGYLPKEVSMEDLVRAVRMVYQGYAMLDPMITRKVLGRISSLNRHVEEENGGITTLEKNILSLAASGHGNKEIADSLNLKDGAVKFHFRHIFEKLKAKDRAHAVAIALKQGLVE